jgi:predicted nuclease of predicted toxin-antitoxin system
MKLLIDNQLPLQLAVHLRGKGDQCEHVLEIGLDESDDLQLWTQAAEAGQIVVSKDEDFVFLANRPGDTGRLIWVRLGNCRNAPLLAAFDHAYEAIARAVDSGQRIIELR